MMDSSGPLGYFGPGSHMIRPVLVNPGH